jgi:hypothetical protein
VPGRANYLSPRMQEAGTACAFGAGSVGPEKERSCEDPVQDSVVNLCSFNIRGVYNYDCNKSRDTTGTRND